MVINAVLRWPPWSRNAASCLASPKTPPPAPATYAPSEAGSGSDAFALQTRACRDGDAWVLDGCKLWITNALEAGIFLVIANANPEAGCKGIACFISSSADRQVSRWNARKTSSASAPPPHAS